jgi:predicted regulator of Ras-like GTPase activity (Roadblock/LC7/MglB family)
MKMRLPNCFGVAVYSLNDGLTIAEDINFPDHDPDYASAIHVSIWNNIKDLLFLLPDGLSGNVINILLEVKSAYFQLQVAGKEELLILAAIEHKENLGMLRVMLKKYIPRITRSLEE